MCEEIGDQQKTSLCSAVARSLHAFTYLHGVVLSASGRRERLKVP